MCTTFTGNLASESETALPDCSTTAVGTSSSNRRVQLSRVFVDRESNDLPSVSVGKLPELAILDCALLFKHGEM